MKPIDLPSRVHHKPQRSGEDRPEKSGSPSEDRMRILLFGCSADDAQRTLRFGDRAEVAYLPSYDFTEIRDEIDRFNPQLVTCSTSVFLLGLRFQPSEVLMSNGEHTSTASELSAVPHVAPREMKVLTMLAKGRTNNEIAMALRISSRTVKRILSSLFERFAATNRTELASRAAKCARLKMATELHSLHFSADSSVLLAALVACRVTDRAFAKC